MRNGSGRGCGRGKSALLAAAVALLAMSAVTSRAAGDDWREFQNSHFFALSNASEDDVLSLLTELERFHAVVQDVTVVNLPDDAPKTVVVIFRSAGEYLDYAPGRNVAGHVVKGTSDQPPVVFLPVKQRRMDSIDVIRHEFVHALLRFHPVAFPRWYEEGLAEFLRTARIEEDSVVLGLPPADRMKHALELLPFDEIMAEDFNPHVRTVSFGDPYLQYWLLVDYLLLGRGETRGDLETYLKLVHLGTPSLDAFGVAFRMTPTQLWNAEIKSYASNLKTRIKLWTRPLPAAQLDLDFRSRPVAGAEAGKFLQVFKPAQ